MQGLHGASFAALEYIVNASPEEWSVSDSATLGVLIASLQVPDAGFSVSVTGWTREELRQRMALIRAGASAVLEQQRAADPAE